nr:circularly permuted type 2 ATP-grasp protein [uncultured Duganella sp.]
MPKQLLSKYLAAPDSFDEMLDASKEPRPHWRAMLDGLRAETPDLMRQRLETVQREVRQNGVTYTVYGDTKGTHRPWDLNLLPLILPRQEWEGIEAAVIQRATLLNRLLGDVYGPQNMLKEGLLPPALIHGHAGFLRAAHGMRHPDDIALHFYAVDLARAPNGRWWATADRTQSPSGAGYALENRSIVGRSFPALLRDMKVRPLEGFFGTMRDSLAHWGRRCAANGDAHPLRAGEAPLIVLLTPGPYNETYYEQAYLSRYLGLPLVEAGDLTVRGGIVFMKTLSGLRRVHVIMRRVDDDFCDPLELRSDSALGVAGLTEAARRGNVLVTNSLGSNLLESGALLGFLPALSERLLGQPLRMPSVATWWCGEPAALEEAIEKLDQLVIMPAFPQLRQAPVYGRDLKDAARAALIAQMRANPNNYVAHELVRLSQGPVYQPETGRLSAHSIGLRVFACATPDGYVVMPGGLTRVATGPDARVITMQHGGGSKDTWVQASSQARHQQPVPRSMTAQDLVRDDTQLSSRMAENLFWLGRHTERCDDIARLLRVALNIVFNVRAGYPGAEWPTVESLCAWFQLTPMPEPEPAQRQSQQSQSQDQQAQSQDQQTQTQSQDQMSSQSQGQTQSQGQSQGGAPEPEPAPARIAHDAQIEAALLLAVVSPDVPGLARQQQQLYNTASQLRERLSVDNWRALNRLVERAGGATLPSQSEAMTILDDAAASLMTLTGFGLDGMTRDMGWRFLSLGRRLERLQFQSMVVRAALGMDPEGNLDWVLELSDSIVTYRARYRAQPEWLPVLDLLILDDSNPRSISHQLHGVLAGLRKIATVYGPCGEHNLAPLHAELLSLSPEADLYGANPRLIDLLARVQNASEVMAEQIGLQFFSYTGSLHNKFETPCARGYAR